MRKSTTKMLSLILAFLMAFSSLSMPVVAAPVDGEVVVSDENVIEVVSEEVSTDMDVISEDVASVEEFIEEVETTEESDAIVTDEDGVSEDVVVEE